MIYLPNSSRYPLKDYRKGKKKKTYKVIHKKPKKKKNKKKRNTESDLANIEEEGLTRKIDCNPLR